RAPRFMPPAAVPGLPPELPPRRAPRMSCSPPPLPPEEPPPRRHPSRSSSSPPPWLLPPALFVKLPRRSSSPVMAVAPSVVERHPPRGRSTREWDGRDGRQLPRERGPEPASVPRDVQALHRRERDQIRMLGRDRHRDAGAEPRAGLEPPNASL